MVKRFKNIKSYCKERDTRHKNGSTLSLEGILITTSSLGDSVVSRENSVAGVEIFQLVKNISRVTLQNESLSMHFD